MNKKLIITLVILALVIVGVLFYSNQPAPETKKEEVSVSNPDTITKVNMGTIDSLDPHYQYDERSQEIYVNIYENLISFKQGDMTKFEPMLATKVPSDQNGLIQDKGTSYVFPIREDVKFHEGGTLTPEDIRYSFLRSLIHDREGGPLWMLYDPLFGVGGLADITKELVGVEDPKTLTAEQSREVYNYLARTIEVDGQNVIFHLPKPYPPFLSIICHDNGLTAIMDKEWAIEQGGWDGSPETIAKYHDPTKEVDPFYDKTNGTGPFKLENWVKGESITLKKNDDYWRAPAKVENVVIKMIDEWSTRKLMLQRGDADIVYVDNQYLDQARDLDNVKIISGLPRPYTGVGLMNWDIVSEGNPDVHSGKLDGKGIPADFFSDLHVRKGFVYAMNYQAFVAEVMKGEGQQSRGPIPEGFLGFDEDSDLYSMDLDKATEEFKQAFDGELWDKGFEITILYNSGNDMRKAAVDMLKSSIEGINDKFKVHVRGVQWATYLDKLIAGKFTLGFIGWGADFADSHNFAVPFMRSDGTYGAFKGENYAKFAKDQEVDELITRAAELTDPVEREKIYQELQQLCYDYATDIYLYQPAAHLVMRDWVSGWEYDPIIHDGVNFYYLDK
ncbi:ABC transporter substrate-binding protein [Iocasia frigidifontis]|uniref:ABC transporter substrate-binding protein n=1 Tax=Iocasia fonsfrigidae TaxID=2682810 RepID=A0A8A7KBA3_9FIRM|nr:ABC transporter substrate-binding protein [Iocasia fonsfrigidae]QTL98721.1 ABC transporter substrate-binding protein [Iocasia fonsfrigidae]